jgi:excisionase family DNA binding protein
MADDTLASDLLNGASAIAEFLNISPRQAYHLLESGKLPAFKFGGRTWQARRSTLLRHIERLESQASA